MQQLYNTGGPNQTVLNHEHYGDYERGINNMQAKIMEDIKHSMSLVKNDSSSLHHFLRPPQVIEWNHHPHHVHNAHRHQHHSNHPALSLV